MESQGLRATFTETACRSIRQGVKESLSKAPKGSETTGQMQGRRLVSHHVVAAVELVVKQPVRVIVVAYPLAVLSIRQGWSSLWWCKLLRSPPAQTGTAQLKR